MEIYAQRLQTFVREHLGHEAPIVDLRAWPRPVAPELAIVITPAPGFGDMYSGGVDVEELRLVLPRADGSEPLRVTYSVGIHQLSGQCDLDQLEIANGRPDEIEALRALFGFRGPAPQGRDVQRLIINGKPVAPWDAS